MTIADVATQPTDAERFKHILDVQRAAYLRDGAPSLAARRQDLDNLKAALIARRGAIEEAINIDFGHRSRHETAMMELVGVVQGIDYLRRNLRRFMRPTRRLTPRIGNDGSDWSAGTPGSGIARPNGRSSGGRGGIVPMPPIPGPILG